MKTVHLIDAKRSPIGRFGGGLKSVTAPDLASAVAHVLVPPALRDEIQQVIVGQVLPAGSGMNAARQVVLKLGLPQRVPGFTVNMACGSSLKAVSLAADAIRSGESDLVLAGGVEVMSRAPHYVSEARWGRRFGDLKMLDALSVDGLTDPSLGLGMGDTAERIADRLGISREDQDAFAVQSQQKAAANRPAFRREIVPVNGAEGLVSDDEHPRADTTRESLARLKPAFRVDGTVTPGNASGLNDGAAWVLLGDAAAARRLGLTSRARIVASVAVGCDPALMGLGPVGAIRRLCELTGWTLDSVDVVEINEAFAAQVLGCVLELGLDPSKLNVRGGAIALGHPLGASGARILVTLLHLMEDRGVRRGICSLCIGGGMGIAMAVER